MKIFILCGGKGTRLQPYTNVLPKPLMPVGDIPILEIIISQLKSFGFKDIIISVGYLKELIESYFGDGTKFGVNITYVKEDKPLNTIAPLRLAENLGDDFIVMNGDILTDLDYRELIKFHNEEKNTATICTFTKEVKIDFGIIKAESDNRISGFTEKPIYENLVSMGIYALNKKILEYIPDDGPFGFDELMYTLIDNNEKLVSYSHAANWLDLGNHEDYEKAQEIFKEHKEIFLPGKT